MAISHSQIKLNDAVLLKNAIGVVLYKGPVHWIEDKTETYVGLELSTKISNGHNGTYDAQTYFVCRPNQGIILPITAIIRIIKPIELLHKLSKLKQALNETANKNKITFNTSHFDHDQTNNIHRNVQINGILLNESAHKNQYEIQLKDNTNNISSHSLIVPKQYVNIIDNNTENIPNNIQNEIQPLILKPESQNLRENAHPPTKRRSSISGRRYSVTARQNGMYDYWRKFIATTIGDNDNFMLNNGYIFECDGDLKHCDTIKRITFLIEYYDEWIFRKSNNFNIYDVDRMIDFMDNLENYNIIKLMNDYYHLLESHIDGLVLNKEKNISFECTRIDCVSLMRHYKDLCIKNKKYSQKKVLYFIEEDQSDDYDDIYHQRKGNENIEHDDMELKQEKERMKHKEISQEIILQEILDKIHCFLCHNLCCDISKNMNFYGDAHIDIKECLDEQLQDIVCKINNISEWKRIRNIRSMNELWYNKFSTDLVMNDEKKNDGDIVIGTKIAYDTMNSKYSNLKNEILSSERTYRLDSAAWTDIYDLSLIIKQSDKTRKMGRNQTVSIEFIICLILYCNYIEIRNEFSSLSRANIRKKCTDFTHFGRILNKCINIFGAEWNWNSIDKNVYLYHCIKSAKAHSLLRNNKLIFYGATSMTSSFLSLCLFESNCDHNNKSYDRLVFCINDEYEANIESDGVTMKYNNLKYIQCSFINQYEFENEILLMNDDAEMIFSVANIVNVINGYNYVSYLNALKLFDFVFMDNNKQNDIKYGLLLDNIKKQKLLQQNVQEILQKLLQKDPSIPLEIKLLFEQIRGNKNNIKINENAFVNLNKNTKNLIGDQHSVSMHKLCGICPNTNKIHSNSIVLNDENVDFILKILEHNTKLNQIYIVLNNNQSPNLQKILNKYRHSRKALWSLNLDGNTLKLNTIYT